MNSSVDSISVIIGDPHDIYLAGFSALFHKFPNISEVAVAQSYNELSALLQNARFDLALIDLQLNENDGLELFREIKRKFPELKLIGMSTIFNSTGIPAVKEDCFDGFILKSISALELSVAIDTVMEKKKYISRDVREEMNKISWKKIGESKEYYLQLQRNRELLFLISQGLTSRQIAGKMNVAEKTVEKYKKHLFLVTGTKNAVGLALFAYQNNILSDFQLKNKFLREEEF